MRWRHIRMRRRRRFRPSSPLVCQCIKCVQRLGAAEREITRLERRRAAAEEETYRLKKRLASLELLLEGSIVAIQAWRRSRLSFLKRQQGTLLRERAKHLRDYGFVGNKGMRLRCLNRQIKRLAIVVGLDTANQQKATVKRGVLQ